LSKNNPTFGSAIKNYLKNEYAKTKNLPLKSEGEAIPFADFHKTFNKGTHDRTTERNYLYDLLVSEEAETRGDVINMYKHFNKEYRCIDYEAWKKNTEFPDFVEKMRKIQPQLK
jgi:hypothetical protein